MIRVVMPSGQGLLTIPDDGQEIAEALVAGGGFVLPDGYDWLPLTCTCCPIHRESK
jgi:hypothetical protein